MRRRQGIPIVASRSEAVARGLLLRALRCSRPQANAVARFQRGLASRALIALLVSLGLVATLVLLSERASVRPVVATDLPLLASGRAESIDDGDTFVFVSTSRLSNDLGPIRIRLHGVDAPELLQPHGAAARSALNDLLSDARISVDCYKRDARGRAICRVHVESERVGAGSRDVELALLEAGHVWHYAAYASEQSATDRERYAMAMAQARAARRGLWQDDAALAPWACRARLRAGKSCD